MSSLAIIIPYFNHTGSALAEKVFSEGVQRWRSIHNDVFTSEISNSGRFLFGGANAFQFKGHSFIWYKENAINLAVERLPLEFTKVAWIDADCEIQHPDIIGAIHDGLEKVDALQCARDITNLGPEGEEQSWHPLKIASDYPANGACGFCWAAKRTAFKRMNGLPAFQICGGGDTTFCAALGVDMSVDHPQASGDFKRAISAYVRRGRAARLRWSYIDAPSRHHHHADRKRRCYEERYAAMGFYRSSDLRRDSEGVLFIKNPFMEQLLREYFFYRSEG